MKISFKEAVQIYKDLQHRKQQGVWPNGTAPAWVKTIRTHYNVPNSVTSNFEIEVAWEIVAETFFKKLQNVAKVQKIKKTHE